MSGKTFIPDPHHATTKRNRSRNIVNHDNSSGHNSTHVTDTLRLESIDESSRHDVDHEPSASRTGLKASKNKTYPTRPLKNEICHNFIMNRCRHSSDCSRIHPRDKGSLLPKAIEEKKPLGRELKPNQAPCASVQSTIEPSARDAPPTVNSPQATGQVKLPAATATMTTKQPTCHQKEPHIVNFRKNRAFATSLAGVLQQRSVRPFEDTSSRSKDVAVSTDTSLVNGTQVPAVKEQKHPHPKHNERCKKWLRNQCNLGYQCLFVHEDLEYDDPPQARSCLEGFSTTLHDHIKFKLHSGFDVQDIVTGFESSWIFISNLPKNISDNLLSKLLHPFGKVVEIRRPLNLTSPLTVKIHFANSPDAYRAFTSLHGTTEFGCKLEVRMGLDLDNKGTLVKDSVVRIDWDAPHRTWYAGFSSTPLAERALQVMQNTPYDDFLPTASLHTALPAVNVATVKMMFLPLDVDEKKLKIFGPVQGLMSERSNYRDYTVQETAEGIKKLFSRFQTKMIDFEVCPPPYREAKMRAWAYFTTPADAKAAAEYLHGRKPPFTSYTKIYAQHIKKITFTIPVIKFRRVATSIHSLSESIWKQDAGYSLSVSDKNSHFCLELCGEDLKLLGRLKAEVEKILNGETVVKDRKTAWDDLFGRHAGILFLQDLERANVGVSIEKDITRRKIRLFGAAEKRAIVREKILEKIEQLQLQQSYLIHLDGPLIAPFLNGELASLKEKLGSENIILDLACHALRLRGDEKMFNAARDAVVLVSQKYKVCRKREAVSIECPVCFDEASFPIKMTCGHSWCRTCFQNYLTAAIQQKFFPLTCLGNEARCTERISLHTAKEVLSAADFDAMVSAAFDVYVQTHPEEIQYCPTPDCLQVFRPVREGIFLQCPSCLVRICPNCKTEAHDGLTCAELKDGLDDLFKGWADEHDVKRCPGCHIAIEKAEGCNHMKCTVCQTHICWVCMKTFPGGDGIYGHMQNEHGGFGLGPIT